jgi:hypothetical protein
MPSFGMLRHAAHVRTNVSEELIASIIRVTRIDELGTTLAVTSNRRTLQRNAIILVTAAKASNLTSQRDDIAHNFRVLV